MIVYGVDETGKVVPLPIRSDGLYSIAGKQVDGTVTSILVDRYGRVITTEVGMAYGFQLDGFHGTLLNPLDNTNYYIGRSFQAPGTTVAVPRMFVMRSCKLKLALLKIRNWTVVGSGESVVVDLLVNSVTVYSLWTNVTITGGEQIYTSAALNINIIQGDSVELRARTPVWATNPTGVEFVPSFWFEVPDLP